jgi:outer membrane protein assembly factor BamB
VSRGVSSSPAIGADGTIYIGAHDKGIYALDGKTGELQWKIKTGTNTPYLLLSEVRSSPSIGTNGTLYIGSGDKNLYALRTDSKGLAKSPWPMRGQNAQHTGRALK